MKQKKQLAVLAVLLVILVVVAYFYFDSDKQPVVTADAGKVVQNNHLLAVDNLSIHTGTVEKARKTEYKSSGRNIFSRELPPPLVPPPPRVLKPGDQGYVPPIEVPPPPPKVTPLPVKFFGYGTVPNGTVRLAFFNDSEDVYIVKEGELLMNRFRILKINNANLEYEDPAGLRGTVPLEDQGGGPSAQ
ncbi:MAG TPA: hypothetical protein VJO16_00475 [Candidatus Acidoferrum sp.]|nr:hypothetical protein [Candidatus Acidoferrum sp.]